MKSPRANRGVALVTALLIVSLATVAAVSFATQQQLDIRRTGNLIDGDQAWAYARAAEDWAKLILKRDSTNTEFDALTEVWARPLPPIELPGGYMVGRISDAQARINLNNLQQSDPNTNATETPFGRLLLVLELDPNLAQAVMDWLDTDINARPPDGAEDDYYAGLKQPYRTSNQPMKSVSELRLVKGFDEKAYQKIAPFVTALPTTEAPINVNTAPAEVLATLADNVDLKSAMALVKLREENPFEDIDPDFKTDFESIAGANTLRETEGLGVNSEYFDVNVETRIGYGRAALSSLLWRGEGDIQVIRRAQGLN